MSKKVLFALSKSTSDYTLKVLSSEVIKLIVIPAGIEPSVSCVKGRCLSHLTTGPKITFTLQTANLFYV